MRLAIGLALALAGSHAVAAELVLVECSEPNGSSYYFEGGIVPPGQGGARPDGMAGGRIRVIQPQEGGPTIVETRDANGTVTRKKPERTSSFTLRRPDGGISIISTTDDPDEKIVDTFLFSLNSQLVGTVVWQFAKIHPAVTKTSTFTAPCRAAP